jgi:molybdopterin-guanine dinucleotide biosynthesis protein A
MFEQMDTLQPVILAGGDDSRMGYNKALASFEGTTLIETIYTLLDFIFDKSPMVVTNDKAIFKDIDCLKRRKNAGSRGDGIPVYGRGKYLRHWRQHAVHFRSHD